MAERLDRKELEARVVARAWTDPAYKQLLSTDPKEAVRQETGAEIPAIFEVTVLEETPTHGYLVLPFNAAELSDEQLEAAAAGNCGGALTYTS